MKLQDLTTKDLKITSLEILEQINFFRKKEREEEKTHSTNSFSEKKNRLNQDMQHTSLMRLIRDEFDVEISRQEILLSEYENERGRKYPMFILTNNQAKQILLRESKFVRRAVIQYIENLEKELEVLKLSTGTKKKQIEAMELLYKFLPELEKTEAISYIKANSVVNKITSNIHGFPKMLKKDEMSPIMILTRDKVLDEYVKLYEVLEDNHEVSEVLKRKYSGKLIS